MNGMGSSNVRDDGAPIDIQTILDTGHCRSSNYSSAGPNVQQKLWLTYLEVVLLEVTCNWHFKELLRREVQIAVEQLVHRDDGSTENESLHRWKCLFVETCRMRQPSEGLHSVMLKSVTSPHVHR